MKAVKFEDLELHVQTLAFQIAGLKKNNLKKEHEDSLKILEKDYRYYKKQYDQMVENLEETVSKEESSGDW